MSKWELVNISSGNGLAPKRRHAITWTKTGKYDDVLVWKLLLSQRASNAERKRFCWCLIMLSNKQWDSLRFRHLNAHVMSLYWEKMHILWDITYTYKWYFLLPWPKQLPGIYNILVLYSQCSWLTNIKHWLLQAWSAPLAHRGLSKWTFIGRHFWLKLKGTFISLLC